MKPIVARSRIKKLDRRIKLLKTRENRLIRAIVRLEGKKEKLKDGIKGSKREPEASLEPVFTAPTYEPIPTSESASDSFSEKSEANELETHRPNPSGIEIHVEQNIDKREEAEPEESTHGTLKSLLPKGLDLQKVEVEVQRLKANAERVEDLLREADEAMNSMVKSMGYFGIKPKRGTWAYRRWRKLQREVERDRPAGTGLGGLDLGAMLSLASMFTGGEGSNNTTKGMGLVGELLKSPTVQNLVINAISGFMKKK